MQIAGYYANCLVGMMGLCKLLDIMQIVFGMMGLCKLLDIMQIAGWYDFANCLVGMMALCKLLDILHIAGHYGNCLVGMMALWKLPNEGDILQNAQFIILPITYR